MIPATRSANAMSDMAKVMEQVRNMRDSELADVLAGKNMSVPQYAAMAEAMGRRQLRDAVKGAEAQQQAKQPSVKDQLLMADAQEAGLAALPAPNMESVDMASGGIIAFEDGGKVQHFYDQGLVEAQQKEDQESLIRTAKELGLSVADVLAMAPRAGAGILNAGPIRSLRAAGLDLPYIPDVAGGDFSSKTPFYDKYIRQADIDKAAAKALEKPIGDQPGDYPMPADVKAAKDSKGDKGAPAAPSGSPAGLNYLLAGSKFERRASPFGSFTPEEVDYNKLKDQGMGEGLMKMGAGLLSAPGSKGFAAGIQALAESGAISRKEIAGLKKDARDYKLNVAKAEEAFNQGQDELGFKYMENANLNKYRMASLAQEPGELRTLRAIAADPSLAAFAKGNKGAMSITDAAKEFNDMAEKNPAMYRDLKKLGVNNPRDYLTYVTTGLPPGAVSATVPEGAKTRS